jgi:taurine dioxygenase
MMTRETEFTITDDGDPIGASILGVDLAGGAETETVADIHAALDARAVVCLRDQTLSPDDFLAFAKCFGEIEINTFNKFALEGYPEILKVSNIMVDGKNVGYADAGTHWHSDMSYTATPPSYTMLYALEVPHEDGRPLGDTLFAGTAVAHDALPAETRQRIGGLRATHDFAAKPRGLKKPVALTSEQIAANPAVVHPVARAHPRTGRPCLYVNAGECTGIEGVDEAEALALIEVLVRHCLDDRFRYRHIWRVGDVLIWDNCAVQHVALRDYAWPQRRMMLRATVGGTVPV